LLQQADSLPAGAEMLNPMGVEDQNSSQQSTTSSWREQATGPFMTQLSRMASGIFAQPGVLTVAPASVLLRQRTTSSSEQGGSPETHSRTPVRDALRQVTRENMDAEVHEGIAETLSAGAYPSVVGVCFCLGTLCICFLLVALLVCVCCCIMNLAGVCLTCWLLSCDHQKPLKHWLILLQLLVLAEGCFVGAVNGCLRGCLLECVVALDARVRPGFTRASMDLSLVVLSSAWKVAWCVHAQTLVTHAPANETGCAQSLPRFMDLYSRVLLLQVIMVQPTARLVMSILLYAATSGVLATRRGAKPGTLEALEAIEFDPELFADPENPADGRPQKECPICLEDYVPDAPVVRTHCQHLMHRHCLGRWLQASHFCPICRADLELDQSPQP